MREVERVDGAASRTGARRGRRFSDALRAAAHGGPVPVGGSRSPQASQPAALRTAPQVWRTSPPAPPAPDGRVAPRIAAAESSAQARRACRPGEPERREGERSEPVPNLAVLQPPSPVAPQATFTAPPELRALVRALPLAVETFGVRDGAPLALSFGRSLEVELRAVPGGVALVLRADARLARASAAGLAELVAALGRRGVAVVRSEVRGRGGGAPGGAGERGPRLPFVDLPVPLR